MLIFSLTESKGSNNCPNGDAKNVRPSKAVHNGTLKAAARGFRRSRQGLRPTSPERRESTAAR